MHAPTSYEALQQSPVRDVLESIRDRVAPGAEIGRAHRVSGGMWCGMHAVDFLLPSGESLGTVVRRYPTSYLAQNPEVHRREWEALQAAAVSSAPTPRPLLLDPDGAIAGVPTLVMSRLSGRPLARRLALKDMDDTAWVEPVARALARLHAVVCPIPAGQLPILVPGEWARALLEKSPERDERVRELSLGREILETLGDASPLIGAERPVLLHGDYHPSNILWARNDVSGVVDWSEAQVGPREYDLAHMRWEIALRFELAGVDRFLHAYEDEAGIRIPRMSVWDLMQVWRMALALPSWVWFFELERRTDGTLETLRVRRDAFAVSAMQRVTASGDGTATHDSTIA